ncbi:MAG: flavin reductase family protein [Mesorhizobium sp.]
MSDVSPEAMRRTLGRFCTGVTVIAIPHEDGFHAMTANAFMSVSLDPPLVLVSVDKRARMRRYLDRPGCSFGVSILHSSQESVAWHFAGRPIADGKKTIGIEESGFPFVVGSIAHVGCSLEQTHEAGDHTLYIGRVSHLWSSAGEPLLFHCGKFELIEKKKHDERWA